MIDLTDGLTDDIATYRPDPEANSIAWLLWHLGRGQDHQVAELAQVEQVWPQWRERFGLPFDKWATGYGQGPEEVAAVRVVGTSSASITGCSRADAALPGWHYCRRAGSDRGYPLGSPVTAAVRLVSVIGDTMHAGQAAYVRGLAKRRDKAWHSRVLPSTKRGLAPRALEPVGSCG